ncbi:unnamed protein product [Lathyrus sativus]|nr:unnamed protein product [Lathyrus sativus]CAK8075942.1 unnamed protein product [Lathyrus sativus]
MLCTANDLQGWKDFSKGFRVLLLEGDNNSATEIRIKLEDKIVKFDFIFYRLH